LASRFDLVGVRAVTVHAVVEDWGDPGSVARALRAATEKVRAVARVLREALDVEPWSLRVTLPPAPLGGGEAARVVSEAVRALGGLPGDVAYSLLHLDAGSASPEDFLSVLGLGGNVYGSAYTPVATEAAAELLYRVAAAGPGVAERFAVAVPSPVETPYFPVGSSGGPSAGVSAALLYPRLLEGRNLYAAFDDLADAAAELEDALLQAGDELGLEYRGLDLSLSPWMDESSARIVEQAAGGSICGLGAAGAVAELEELIGDTCLDLECTGFNQVMLPVAEDNVLKERVREGCLTVQRLLHLSASCAAGVDMAPVPASEWTPEQARRLLADLAAAARLKSRPLAARLIAVDRAPGETVELPRFGETPVARLH